ncbi:MAG: hypothetical protein M0Z85_12520 [Gammaproteobacteria bacterium]|jgi:hypothetical protein|nr:hypothetical protein [Gammaproteobacteria bacterium]
MPSCNKGDAQAQDHTEQIDRCVLIPGPSIGQYQGGPIPAWIQNAQGVVWDFARVVADPGFPFADDFAGDEVVVKPGLVYKRHIDE